MRGQVALYLSACVRACEALRPLALRLPSGPDRPDREPEPELLPGAYPCTAARMPADLFRDDGLRARPKAQPHPRAQRCDVRVCEDKANLVCGQRG